MWEEEFRREKAGNLLIWETIVSYIENQKVRLYDKERGTERGVLIFEVAPND